MEQAKSFPDWQQRYLEDDVEQMPWFYQELDPDLLRALQQFELPQSATFLDLGSGSGSQAIELARRGFCTSGTDLSSSAIEHAVARAEREGVKVDFQTDDVLNTNLKKPFDCIFDRGCFHILPPDRREHYVRVIYKLLEHGGYFFLKCFSVDEEWEEGPYRFSTKNIYDLFAAAFTVLEVRNTEFQGTREPLPKALFCVFTK